MATSILRLIPRILNKSKAFDISRLGPSAAFFNSPLQDSTQRREETPINPASITSSVLSSSTNTTGATSFTGTIQTTRAQRHIAFSLDYVGLVDRANQLRATELVANAQLASYVRDVASARHSLSSIVSSKPTNVSTPSVHTRNIKDSEKLSDFLDSANWKETRNVIKLCPRGCSKTSFFLDGCLVPEVTFECVELCRLQFCKLDNIQRRQLLIELILNHRCCDTFNYSFSDIRIEALCKKCFRRLFHIPKSSFNFLAKRVLIDGLRTAELLGNQLDLHTEGTKTVFAKLFIEKFITDFGTEQKNLQAALPDTSVYNNAEQVYLIDNFKREELFTEYKWYCYELDGEDSIVMASAVWLMKIWKQRLGQITPFPIDIRQNTGLDTGCQKCIQLYKEFQNAQGADARKLAVHERILHRVYVGQNRSYVLMRAVVYGKNPSFLICGCDGFDTFKALLPLISLPGGPLAKVLVDGWKLKLQCSMIIHQQCQFMLFQPWIVSGANLHITAFHASLAAHQHQRHSTPFPKVIFKAFDGGPENWNKTVMAYCGWLVGHRFCDMVEVCRLPAHHAYFWPDAKFGSLSRCVLYFLMYF
jgi:hypothetical protein